MKIAVIGGDGTGPEVVAEGLKVLAAVAKQENFTYELTDFDLGGERYLRTGETLPVGMVDELRSSTPFIWVRSVIPMWPPACWKGGCCWN